MDRRADAGIVDHAVTWRRRVDHDRRLADGEVGDVGPGQRLAASRVADVRLDLARRPAANAQRRGVRDVRPAGRKRVDNIDATDVTSVSPATSSLVTVIAHDV